MEGSKCEICCEEYNKKNRKKIVCCACEYKQCQNCVKKFLLLLLQVEPKCMNCNVEWKINFLKKNLPKNFLEKQYKQHQKDVIFEKERQHFPELMNEIQEERDRESLFEQSINITQKIRKQMSVKRQNQLQIRQIRYREIQEEIGCQNCMFIHRYKFQKNVWETSCVKCQERIIRTQGEQQEQEQEDIEKIKEHEQKIQESDKILDELFSKEDKIQKKIDKLGNKKQKQIYYIHCPKNECNGLVNNEKDQCGICDTKICKKCNEVIEQQHKCKQENIESAKKIRSQCKQCPTCKIQIYRIEGCDDMFCVQCKTSFNWLTGEKMQQTTNPHYYEYIRQNNIQDIDDDTQNCENDLIDIRVLTQFLQSESVTSSMTRLVIDKQNLEKITTEKSFESMQNKITDIHQRVNHIESIQILKLQENIDINAMKMRKLCKQYLNNLLNEKNLKDKLQKIRKEQEKKRNFQQILEAYVEVAKKEINEIPQQRSIENIIKKVEIIENFKKYIQEQIEQTKNDYDSKMKLII